MVYLIMIWPTLLENMLIIYLKELSIELDQKFKKKSFVEKVKKLSSVKGHLEKIKLIACGSIVLVAIRCF